MAEVTVRRVDFGYLIRLPEETGTGMPRAEQTARSSTARAVRRQVNTPPVKRVCRPGRRPPTAGGESARSRSAPAGGRPCAPQWSSSWLTSSRLVTWWRAGSPSPVTSTRNWRRIVSNTLSTLPLPGALGALWVSLIPSPAGPRISGSPARQASALACGSGRSAVRPPSWRSRRRGGRARRRSPSRCLGPSSGSSWFHRPADRTARAGSGGRWPARLGPASAC